MKVFPRDNPEVEPEMLVRLEAELRKYLEMRGTYTARYGISGRMDKLLHSFILCTEEYTEFCQAAFGQYLHHSPKLSDSSDIPIMYFRFLVDYVRYFKEIPSSDIWPYSSDLFGDTSSTNARNGECIADCFGPPPPPVP